MKLIETKNSINTQLYTQLQNGKMKPFRFVFPAIMNIFFVIPNPAALQTKIVPR